MKDASRDCRPVVVTGAAGFVGGWLIRALRERLADTPVVATSLRAGVADCLPLDIRETEAVDCFLRNHRPRAVVHLAAISYVPDADEEPAAAYDVNLRGTMNVAQGILKHVPDCNLVFVGSSEVYGGSFLDRSEPINEQTLLDPLNAYAASKAAADLFLGQVARRGLHVTRFRPFNHSGPGQAAHFVLPSFARQIVASERGLRPPVIDVGNLNSVRDFLDVRDVVRAYCLAIERPDAVSAGTILNLASGVPRRIRDVLDHLVDCASVPIKVRIDPARVRATEIPFAVGNADHARKTLGWQPEIDFARTVHEVLQFERENSEIP